MAKPMMVAGMEELQGDRLGAVGAQFERDLAGDAENDAATSAT